jgi:hypothetical protein
MKVTLGQILEAGPALNHLAAERLPIKMAYWIARLAKMVGEEQKTFFEARAKTIEELDVAKGDMIDVKAAGYPAFKAKMDELVAVEIDLAWTPLTSDKLGDVTIAAADLLALSPFITEAAEPEARP